MKKQLDLGVGVHHGLYDGLLIGQANGIVNNYDVTIPNIIRQGLIFNHETWNQFQYLPNQQMIKESANNYTGTFFGTIPYNYNYDGYLTFNGSTHYIRYGNVLGFTRTDPITIQIWLNYNLTNQVFNLFSKQPTTSPFQGWGIGSAFRSGVLYIEFFQFHSTASTTDLIIDVPLNNNKWHLLTVSYDGSNSSSGVKFYYNTTIQTNIVIQGGGKTDTIINNVDLQLSGRNNSANNPFPGNVSSVRVYNFAMNLSQVDHNFNAERKRFSV